VTGGWRSTSPRFARPSCQEGEFVLWLDATKKPSWGFQLGFVFLSEATVYQPSVLSAFF
jgi:hypothetical protein